MTVSPLENQTNPSRKRITRLRLGPFSAVVAIICVLPVMAVVVAALTGTFDTWRHLVATVLPGYALNTFLLCVSVLIGAGALGTAAAWLVTMTRFPGVRVLEVLLALPLAFPAYVLAYAYTSLLSHSGPVQSGLRGMMGWGPSDYWFPDIRSLPGAAVMLILVLYPYVYLLARASFLQQSASAFIAARALGRGPWHAFWAVSLPMARPAIAGGALLAVMETLADFGTVAHFGVQTLATGIYQSWFSMGDRTAAAQLAFCLMTVALFVTLLDRQSRGDARHHNTGRRFEKLPPMPLRGWRAAAAVTLCAAPVAFGFVLPVIVLAQMAVGSGQDVTSPRYLYFIGNSLTLAGLAAAITMAGAMALQFHARFRSGRGPRTMVEIARLGYAVPGGVIAVGLLVPAAGLDNGLDAWMRNSFGISTGLLLTGSIGLLLMAYLVRFSAVALGALDGGLAPVSRTFDHVAQTLGADVPRTIWRVHLPIIAPSVLTGALIVFVDVMKELPATLILRPFNFDTLAVQAFRLSSDERLNGAAVPSLIIVAIGLLPVILVLRTLSRRGPA